MAAVRRSDVAHVTVAAVIGCCLALAGCSGATESGPGASTASSEATDSSTSLETLDTSGLVVPRAPFCNRVDADAVTRALGEEARDVSAYRSGQRIRISDDLADVVHEFGCRWSARDGTAEAWVFAPPVTRRRAADLVEQVRRASKCRDQDEAPDFGRPSAACSSKSDESASTSLQGLFGDAWLTCSLTLANLPQSEVDNRATQWCAAVATSAAEPS